MKAWIASDRNGNEGLSLVVFANTAGLAKAYTARTDIFCDYGFTGIRVNRCKALDQFYNGKVEMDWRDPEERIAMVRYANFECTSEISFAECHCDEEQCPAREWCARYERMNDDRDCG